MAISILIKEFRKIKELIIYNTDISSPYIMTRDLKAAGEKVPSNDFRGPSRNGAISHRALTAVSLALPFASALARSTVCGSSGTAATRPSSCTHFVAANRPRARVRHGIPSCRRVPPPGRRHPRSRDLRALRRALLRGVRDVHAPARGFCGGHGLRGLQGDGPVPRVRRGRRRGAGRQGVASRL